MQAKWPRTMPAITFLGIGHPIAFSMAILIDCGVQGFLRKFFAPLMATEVTHRPLHALLLQHLHRDRHPGPSPRERRQRYGSHTR